MSADTGRLGRLAATGLVLAAAGAACASPAPEPRAAEAPRAETSPEAASPAPAPPAAPEFAAVRRRLLAAVGPRTGVNARVWTVPDPVPDRAPYRVHFRPGCRCAAYVFAIDAPGDSIALLYPNPYEPGGILPPDGTVELPASGAYRLRAVGGEGMDVIKLFVTAEPVDFPPPGEAFWVAEPDRSERVAELYAFLAALYQMDWATAATPLHIRDRRGSAAPLLRIAPDARRRIEIDTARHRCSNYAPAGEASIRGKLS